MPSCNLNVYMTNEFVLLKKTMFGLKIFRFLCFWWVHELRCLWRHHRHYCSLEVAISIVYRIQVWQAYCKRHYSCCGDLKLVLARFMILIKTVIQCDLFLIHDVYHFLIVSLLTFNRVKSCKLIVFGFWSVAESIKKCLDLGPSPPNPAKLFLEFLTLTISIRWVSIMAKRVRKKISSKMYSS